MTNVAKIDVYSQDLYAQGLTREYWKVWRAAVATMLPAEDEVPCETLLGCEAQFDADTGWTCRCNGEASDHGPGAQIDSLYGPGAQIDSLYGPGAQIDSLYGPDKY